MFYGQFGAVSLLADIFWGPESCEPTIRRFERVKHWLDDVSAEAAVAVCADTKHLAFYDCRYSDESQALAARMMTSLWPGWTVESVPYASAVGATVGILPAGQASGDAVELGPIDLSPLSFWNNASLPMSVFIDILREHGRELRICNEHVGKLIHCGPRLIAGIAACPTVDAVRAGAISQVSLEGAPMPLLQPESINPGSLVSIDVNRLTLKVTVLPGLTARSTKAFVLAAGPRWPGWTITCDIGEASEHLAALNEKMPADLLTPKPSVTLDEQLRELAEGLLSGEAIKVFAQRWLPQVEAVVGMREGWLQRPPAGNLTDADRIDRLSTAMQSVGCSTADIRSAISAGKDAASHVGPANPNSPELNWGARNPLGLRSKSLIEHHGYWFALYQSRDSRTEPAVLLRWNNINEPPEEFCPVLSEGAAGYAKLHIAPSGKRLLAVVECQVGYALAWIDLERRATQPIGGSTDLAEFDTDARIAWADRDRFALDFRDLTRQPVGSGGVLVVDWDLGILGEVENACLGAFSEGQLVVSRAVTGPEGHRFVPSPVTLTERSTRIARARLAGVAEKSDDAAVVDMAAHVRSNGASRRAKRAFANRDYETAAQEAKAAYSERPGTEAAFDELGRALEKLERWLELCEVCEAQLTRAPTSRNAFHWLSRALQKLGNLPKSAEAAEAACRCWEYSYDAQLQRARILAQVGQADRAIEAAEMARAMRPHYLVSIACDPELEPLHGKAGFQLFDYERLMDEAHRAKSADTKRDLFRRATDTLPKRSEAWLAWLSYLDDAEQGQLCETWCATVPDSQDANMQRCTVETNAGSSRAEALCHVALERWPKAFEPHLQLARHAMRRGATDEAHALLARARSAYEAQDLDDDFKTVAREFDELAELFSQDNPDDEYEGES